MTCSVTAVSNPGGPWFRVLSRLPSTAPPELEHRREGPGRSFLVSSTPGPGTPLSSALGCGEDAPPRSARGPAISACSGRSMRSMTSLDPASPRARPRPLLPPPAPLLQDQKPGALCTPGLGPIPSRVTTLGLLLAPQTRGPSANLPWQLPLGRPRVAGVTLS